MATPPAPDALADSVLTARYRDGYDDAAAVLFARHHPAALRVARALVPEVRAEDLASEAFTTVLDALRRGEGPSEAFRPYLVTTVRELHPDLHADLRHDGAAVPPADPEQHVEAAVLARAFASLPERWQVALWHTCLQDESDESVSTLLGLDGPAVAALAHRARAGLRRAYVGEHRAVVHGQDCTRARELLPAYVERRTRSDRQLEGHLEQCRDCGGIYLGLRNLRADLGTVLAPALLGGAAG
ncbi:RNA polymerase sigma factor, partial [Nocardioides massiliensis]